MFKLLFAFLFVLLVFNIAVRYFYRSLPKKIVTISSIHIQKIIDKNIVKLVGWIEYECNQRINTKQIHIAENISRENSINMIRSELEKLTGKEIFLYFLPPFTQLGYLDIPYLIGPIWPRIFLCVVYLFIMVSLLSF